MGVDGVIGWYVPGWMAEEYPDITDWENLNEYAELFRTSESGDKGQFLLGDPSYVTNDAALIENLGLDFAVVTGGSEAALIESFGQATTQRTPLLGVLLRAAVGVVAGRRSWRSRSSRSTCRSGPRGAMPSPRRSLATIRPFPSGRPSARRSPRTVGPPYELIKNFSWSNVDQATVSAYISNEGMSPEDAAARWVEENPDKVAAWLPAA